MNSAKRTCIFGPIPSRRLGISLGIDLVPYKTCTMDCIYCECGKTTDQTTERKEYFPTALALKQIDEALDRHPHIDFFTFPEPANRCSIPESERLLRTSRRNIRTSRSASSRKAFR